MIKKEMNAIRFERVNSEVLKRRSQYPTDNKGIECSRTPGGEGRI